MMTTLQVPQQKRKEARQPFTRWAKPYCEASPGMEGALVRYLDDPDVPCYSPGWWGPDKNRFHQERHPGAAKKYVMNPDLWCYAFRDSLTAVSVATDYSVFGEITPNEGWRCKRGVVAITPRHIASCAHAPIGLGGESYPTTVRFVGTDGETYDRTLVGQKYCSNYHTPNITVLVNGVLHAGDSWVGTLDEDLPESVHIIRTIPNSQKFKSDYGDWDTLFVTQSTENESFWRPHVVRQYNNFYPYNQPGYTLATASTYHPAYSSHHRTMAVPGGWGTRYGSAFQYNPWSGDSGMPLFAAYGTELLWAGFIAGGGWGPNGYPFTVSGVSITWEDLVSAMIDASDDDAIARGALAERTGYRCEFANEIPELLPP